MIKMKEISTIPIVMQPSSIRIIAAEFLDSELKNHYFSLVTLSYSDT